jgi:amidohydrolase
MQVVSPESPTSLLVVKEKSMSWKAFDAAHPRFVPPRLEEYEDLYKYLHSHPELSNAEVQTCSLIRSKLAVHAGMDIHNGIGGHSVVGVLKNGAGPCVLLRADIDALPIAETTGLAYRSTATAKGADGIERPVMHACGHDVHATCLLAATEVLTSSALRAHWSGTLIVLFQPAEERGTGAQAMVDDGLWDKIPHPDYLFAQHVVASLPAGVVGLRPGPIMAGAESMRCTVYGRGGHASQPHRTIDAGLLASNCIVRLQQIVSRELPPGETAVLTAVPLSAGVAENIIPNEVEIGVDIRFIRPETRDRLRRSIRRVIDAESLASNAPQNPTFRTTRTFPLTVNDDELAHLLSSRFARHFERDFRPEIPISTMAEDFPNLANTSTDSRSVRPYVFWYLGCADATQFDLEGRIDADLPPVPVNHSSGFAPVIEPTLRAGIEALVVAALTAFETRTHPRRAAVAGPRM